MLSIETFRNEPEKIKENLKKKFQEHKLVIVDEIIKIDDKVRKMRNQISDLRSKRNTLSEQIGGFMRQKLVDEANKLKAEVAEINDKIADLEKEEIDLSTSLKEKMMVKLQKDPLSNLLITEMKSEKISETKGEKISETKSEKISETINEKITEMESEKISEFLTMIKAYDEVLYFEDIRTYREKVNLNNRINNCEQANVEKSMASSNRQIKDIEIIKAYDAYDLLDDKVKVVAEYRIKYPESSLIELSEIISVETKNKITKSCVNHRLRKIISLAFGKEQKGENE